MKCLSINLGMVLACALFVSACFGLHHQGRHAQDYGLHHTDNHAQKMLKHTQGHTWHKSKHK